MRQVERINEIVATYTRHGWQLRSALVRPETRAEMAGQEGAFFEQVEIREAPFDALWFARASHAGREAWELRFVSETPYALFETFEADEDEEERQEVRREMEARLAEYAARS